MEGQRATGVSSLNRMLYHYVVTNDAISTFGHYGRGAKEPKDILGRTERMLGTQSTLDISYIRPAGGAVSKAGVQFFPLEVTGSCK